MRLNITAFSLTAGLIWAGAILMVAVANLAWPGDRRPAQSHSACNWTPSGSVR